jgi:DNA-directed RNA polymerase subunit RPC12/RpoP
MIDIKCPTCGLVYHTEVTHLGKHIKCSRCGSVILLLESAGTVVPSQRVTPTARATPTTRREYRSPRRVLIWAVPCGLALIVLSALAWHAVEKTTADGDERGSPSAANNANQANRIPDTPVGTAGTASIFDIVDPTPIQRKDVASKTPDSTQSRKQEPRPKYYESLPTGTAFCGAPETPGEGVLEIDNGTSEDAAVRLYDASTGETTRCPFVKAHDFIRVTSIPEGTYGLKYASGLDWQVDALTFRWLPTYDRLVLGPCDWNTQGYMTMGALVETRGTASRGQLAKHRHYTR